MVTAAAVDRLTAKLRLTTPLIGVYDAAPSAAFMPLVETDGGWRYRAVLPAGEWVDLLVTKSGYWGFTAQGNKELGQYWPPAV